MRRRDLLGTLAAVPVLGATARRVVLTFDDAVKSHRTFVGPLLKELGFRATFFVTHRWMEDRENFMSWEEIADLHELGFEIGNHSWSHGNFSSARAAARLHGELALVENALARVKVPKPVAFAWSGNQFGPEAVRVLREHGIRVARRGGAPEVEYGKLVVGPALDVRKHHPLLIPTTGDGYPDWTFDHFLKVLEAGSENRVAVLQFHGVPDKAHPWVHTPPEMFERYMRHLKQEGFSTLSLGDVESLYDAKLPSDPMMEHRTGKQILPPEVVATQKDRSYWIANMAEHRHSAEEASRVTGESEPALPQPKGSGLRIAPYPGGRHTRTGFLEGAIDPMRGTKASVFLPWKDSGYVVVDVPEAIFSNLGLLFLAHTHVPTVWDKKHVVIENRDWQRRDDGSLALEWTLPNQVNFGSTVRLDGDAVAMEIWLRNGTASKLTGLRTQVCVLTRGAPGFDAQTNDNKTLGASRATVRSADGRQIHTEWERAGRVWANPRCPCLHSDPVLPDCGAGETVRVTGRLWFA
ncbi:MAG: polysaccharide deacetylase family protein [Bryobacterales bacterium]|nr:polysaccharide deacetylase family protein [Bryobacterales bacterium]